MLKPQNRVRVVCAARAPTAKVPAGTAESRVERGRVSDEIEWCQSEEEQPQCYGEGHRREGSLREVPAHACHRAAGEPGAAQSKECSAGRTACVERHVRPGGHAYGHADLECFGHKTYRTARADRKEQADRR